MDSLDYAQVHEAAPPDQDVAPKSGQPARGGQDDSSADADANRARADQADLGHTQARLVSKLGLLLPGMLRVLDIARLSNAPPCWRVYLAEAAEDHSPEGGGDLGPSRGTLRAYLCFDTDDVGLIYQLRPRRLRLAVDLLELQRTGTESGVHDVG